MKYLAIVLFALAGCDEQQTIVVHTVRYTVTPYPRVVMPQDTSDLSLSTIRDVETGVSYLLVQSCHGLTMVELPHAKAENGMLVP